MTIENYFRNVLTLSVVSLCMGSDDGIFGNTIPPSSLKLLFEPCKNDLPYRLEANVSLSRCVFDCMSRSRCRSIMYRRLASVCGFVDIDDVISSATASGTICVYTSVEGLDRSILGACANHTCSNTETCRLIESGQGYKCVKSECLSPPTVRNGDALTKYQQVNGLVRYTCKTHSKTIGTRIILCGENATWSKMDGACDATCHEPRNIDTADLEFVVGERWGQNRFTLNTVLMYRCKEGYQDEQGQTRINSTCNEHFYWSPPIIPCCKSGWKIHWIYCFEFFNGSDQNSSEGMESLCNQQNSTLHSPFNRGSLNFMKNEVLIPYNITMTVFSNLRLSSAMHQTIQCIKGKEDSVPGTNLQETYTNLTIDCLAKCVNCTNMWEAGQPNMTNECTAYGKDSGYKLRTVPCQWEAGQYGFICWGNMRNDI